MSALVYGLGGGRGHAVRTGALASALASRGLEVSLVVRAGTRPAAPGARIVEFEVPANPREAASRLWSLAPDHPFSLLVVDCFANGVLGEQPARLPARRKILLTRVLRPDHHSELLRHASSYDVIFDLEAHLDWWGGDRVRAHRPVVGAEGRLAGLSTDVLFVASTPAREAYARRASRRLRSLGASVRIATPEADPTLRVADAHVVVGPAGYNLSYECVRAGVHHLALPEARAFDDQRRRAAAVAEIPASPDDLERRALRLLDSGRPRVPPCASADVAELAERLLGFV